MISVRGLVASDRPHDLNTGELALWLAVIMRALLDAEDSPGESRTEQNLRERAFHRGEARSWFMEQSEDFDAVCEFALLEPDAVRARAIFVIENSDRHRPPIASQVRYR